MKSVVVYNRDYRIEEREPGEAILEQLDWKMSRQVGVGFCLCLSKLDISLITKYCTAVAIFCVIFFRRSSLPLCQDNLGN